MKILAPFHGSRKQTIYRYYSDAPPFQMPRESLFGWACFWIAIGLLIGVGMITR